MSKSDQRAVKTLHALLRERFPLAFPKHYDDLRPLKIGILADLIARLPGFDPTGLRRALANHTSRDGYLLALLHGRGDRRYDLDGQPAGAVTVEERATAAQRLAASQQHQQAKAERVRAHQTREARRRRQYEIERRHREEKACRKAKHERRQQEIAARKAALAAQGIVPESRSERKRRLAQASMTGCRPPTAPKSAFDRPPVAPTSQPERPPDRVAPAPASTPSMPQVEFRKKRRIVPPNEKGVIYRSGCKYDNYQSRSYATFL